MLQKETENWRCLYIYIQEALKFTNFSLQKHCKEQDIEITAVQLKLNKKNDIKFCVYRAVIIFCVYRGVIIFCVYRAVIIFCVYRAMIIFCVYRAVIIFCVCTAVIIFCVYRAVIILCVYRAVITFCVYRAPSGDFDYFLNKLDYILNSLHNYKTEFIICGDININYLGTNNKKKLLDYLLDTYNLISTVYFPTRTAYNSATLIDNFFIDNRRHYTIKPCINGLSDHDAQRTYSMVQSPS